MEKTWLWKGMKEDIPGGRVVVSKDPESEIKCSLGGGGGHATRIQTCQSEGIPWHDALYTVSVE